MAGGRLSVPRYCMIGGCMDLGMGQMLATAFHAVFSGWSGFAFGLVVGGAVGMAVGKWLGSFG